MSESVIYITYIFTILSCLLISFFVSGLEAAYTALNDIEWNIYISNQKKIGLNIKLANLMYKNYSITIATLIIVNNMVVLAAGIFSGFWLNFITTPEISSVISLFFISFIFIFFGDFTPKNLFRKYSLKFILKSAYPSFILWIIFYPISYLFGLFFRNNKKLNMTKKDFVNLTNLALDNKIFDTNEAELVSSALEFDDITIEEIMTINPQTIYINDDLLDVIKKYKEHQYTRLVVIDENEDVYGILNSHKLISLSIKIDNKLSIHKNVNIDDAIFEPIFLSANTKLDVALRKMQSMKNHLAIVTPNKISKKMIGIVTLEDIIEELVGEIYDETDENLDIQELDEVTWIVKPNKQIGNFITNELNLSTKLFLNPKMTFRQFFIFYFKTQKILLNNTYESTEISLKVERDINTKKYFYYITRLHDKKKNLDVKWKNIFLFKNKKNI